MSVGRARDNGDDQAPALEALLFDLGNVLVEISFERTFEHWGRAAGLEPARVRDRFSFDAAYERHERGEITASDYFQSLRGSLGIDIPDSAFLDGWNAMLVREVPGVRQLIGRVRNRYPLYAFSNTNVVHHARWSVDYGPMLAPFRQVFASSEMGLRKPEPAAFMAVVDAIGVPPERILFFDDSQMNVEGARQIGMAAVLVTSLDDVAEALDRILL
jgi:putative hydrolase of the HAD superfamily